jgi:hypothetical protein
MCMTLCCDLFNLKRSKKTPTELRNQFRNLKIITSPGIKTRLIKETTYTPDPNRHPSCHQQLRRLRSRTNLNISSIDIQNTTQAKPTSQPATVTGTSTMYFQNWTNATSSILFTSCQLTTFSQVS